MGRWHWHLYHLRPKNEASLLVERLAARFTPETMNPFSVEAEVQSWIDAGKL
jgi:hypothetical protein